MDIKPEQFVTLLRSALHYLYDPEQLRRSPLAILFDVSERIDAFLKLQKILIDAIEQIQPEASEPAQSRGWLLHDVLFFRYVRGYERQAVANQLGISDRQLSREQRAALESLAQYLWKTYRLEERLLSLPDDAAEAALATEEALPPGDNRAQPSAPDPRAAAQGTAWVDELPAEKPTSWKTTFLSVLELIRPLVTQSAVELAYAPLEDLPDLLAPQNALRHSLLNLLGLLAPLAGGGKLEIQCAAADDALSISLALTPPRPGPSLREDPSLAVARRLAERAGGSLELSEEPARLSVRLTLPAPAQIPVLVIDDNQDTIQLFQRYAQGSRYSVAGAPGPLEFFQLLEQIRPRIILLDVMMPELDGWDLLSRLRQERLDQNSAIIICSILPQENLARALGADGFLQKPVLPRDFLRALDEQLNPPAE